MPQDQKKLNLLERLNEDDPELIEPELTSEADLGYRFPVAESLLDTDTAGTLETLEGLARDGFLERQLYERIHLCPECERFTLNFREVCADCNSVRITLTDMIHHYSCGNIGPELNFRMGSKLVCTKCDDELQHIGVDYEKVNTLYYCEHCGDKFEEPNISCRCLSCGAENDISRVEERDIHQYTLSSRGVRAVEEQSLEMADTGAALFDEDYDIFSFEMFREQLSIEFHRARRYDRANTLLIAEPVPVGNGSEGMGEQGMNDHSADMRRIADILKNHIRGADFLATIEDRQFAMILSDTDLEGAMVLARRLKSSVESGDETAFDREWNLYIGLADMTASEDPDRLMEETLNELLRAKENDEDGIRHIGTLSSS